VLAVVDAPKHVALPSAKACDAPPFVPTELRVVAGPLLRASRSPSTHVFQHSLLDVLGMIRFWPAEDAVVPEVRRSG